MYCIKCGVQLDNSVKMCPLCQTKLQYPDPVEAPASPLYPKNQYPKVLTRPGAIKATLLVLFLIPLLVTFLVDWQPDGQINWFGYAAGAIILGFVIFVFPYWFRNSYPVLWVSCDLIATAAYLCYIDMVTLGGWFLTFGLPVVAGFGLPLIAIMLLLRRFPNQKLYISGGALILLGLFTWMVEVLLEVSFQVEFFGWSFCTLGSFVIIGGLLVYLAANNQARERIERKMFM